MTQEHGATRSGNGRSAAQKPGSDEAEQLVGASGELLLRAQEARADVLGTLSQELAPSEFEQTGSLTAIEHAEFASVCRSKTRKMPAQR